MPHPNRFLLGAISLLLAVAPAIAATFVVNDTTDAVDATPGDGSCASAGGLCTLRAAIQEANATTGTDTITVPGGTYVLALVGQDEDSAATGDLDITDDLTITGAGAATTIIDGGGIDRIFQILPTASNVAIAALTIRNGNPGPGAFSVGGGLYNSGMLTLNGVVVTGNTSAASGGGISSDNDITLTDCVVADNTAATFGGGIDNPLTARLENVTVTGNTSGSGGGGIGNDDFFAVATLTNVTIADNTAPAASGDSLYNLGDATLSYVIVADSPSGGNCAGSGTLHSQGHNLDSGSTCTFSGPGDLTSVDPQLGPLQDNGGSTPTRALSLGSPAIDAGGNDCPPPATDQRQFPRPVDGNGDGIATCDIGAYEYGGTAPVTTTTTLPSGCVANPTFDSIDCRLDQLIQTVQSALGAGGLRTGLNHILTSAKTQTGQAQGAFESGKKRRGKVLLGKAGRSLGKFKMRLRSGKAKRLLGSDVLSAMRSSADELRRDLVTLRNSS